MYVRFVIRKRDEDSGSRQGIFQAVGDLDGGGLLLPHEQAAYREALHWFDENLTTPRKFAASSRPHAKKVAISWFKDSAQAHISRMFALVQILEAHGIVVDVIRTNRPGYIVHEDEHQVTAEPFNDTVV